jgi:alkanesulfonate monooxygenase SsuD/methylene tetrahydromethanopterin reductase-like flavin-dependent oxidoreductase (luciferase family)
MPAQVALRLNMTGLYTDPAEGAARYRAAVDMAVYAEQQGFDVVSLEEHHCADNGWLASPLTLAAMIAARTERIRISVTALLVPLYDPIRLAEDIAVIDVVSGGRLSFTAGMGYRPIEYHATGRSFADRGRLMDEAIETLLRAWRGEPFDYRGQRVRVTPRPVSQPHPLILIGGQSRAAARRAARFGLPFHPPLHLPELEAAYHEALARAGKQGLYLHPGSGNSMTVVEPDPERAWQTLGPYFLHEQREYASWKREGVPRPSEETVESVDDLRRQQRFEILTPAACLASLRAGARKVVVLHPLAGGVPLDRAWSGLHRFADEVLVPLRGAVERA